MRATSSIVKKLQRPNPPGRRGRESSTWLTGFMPLVNPGKPTRPDAFVVEGVPEMSVETPVQLIRQPGDLSQCFVGFCSLQWWWIGG